MLLEIAGLTKRFGGVVAVNAVDLSIDEGQVVGLIGPNGAGKTTLINLISGQLAYGDQRRLEIARALAAEPKLLILDEPATGMNPTESSALRVLLRSLGGEGVTTILIEHDVRLVMGACDRVAVLSFGRKI